MEVECLSKGRPWIDEEVASRLVEKAQITKCLEALTSEGQFVAFVLETARLKNLRLTREVSEKPRLVRWQLQHPVTTTCLTSIGNLWNPFGSSRMRKGTPAIKTILKFAKKQENKIN